MPTPETVPAARPGSPGLKLAGYLLFLFIPLVLFLFVRHPRPVGTSLLAGIVLMLGHRFLARPYMEHVRPLKCVWCNRWLQERTEIPLATGRGNVALFACPQHEPPTRRFFGFVDRIRWILRAGIFLPLLALLGSLALAAVVPGPATLAHLPPVTAAFQLLVGLTVNLAAWGYLAARPAPQPAAVFPLHNFYLLGLRGILWVFRLMGIWWIAVGVRYFLQR